MFERHSPVAHAAYHDLLRSLKDEEVSEIRGTPTPAQRNGRTYWYDTYRVGSDVRKKYIGEDSDQLRERIEKHMTLKEEIEQRRKRRMRLVRILRAEGFLGIDAGTGSLLSALSAAGMFRLGGTIVGTHAFRLYEGELGARFEFDQAAQTVDIDIASFERLSLALQEETSPSVIDILNDFAFDPVPGLEPDKAWRWRQRRGETLVEFLTPSFEAEEGRRSLAALGVEAQALHHLNYLIAEPIQAAVSYRNGVLVQIPQPERFAIHKLIVAERRREGPDHLKSEKDRRQAALLIEILATDRPDELLEAYKDAMSRGPRWRERVKCSLKRLPEARVRLEALAG